MATSKPRRPEPKMVRPDDIDPHHRWDRPLQAPGRTQVDFEERINFRRLHDYRLARVRAAGSQSWRSPPSGSTRWARTASRRSTRSPASAARRIRTTSPTG